MGMGENPRNIQKNEYENQGKIPRFVTLCGLLITSLTLPRKTQAY